MFNSSLEFDFSEGGAAANDEREGLGPSNAVLSAGLERAASLLAGPAAKREALRRAAAAIRFSARRVAELVAEQGPEGVHALGIGYELCGVVTDWVRSGRFGWLEALEARGQRELIAVPGIGPRLARELKVVLGVVDLQGLARAARDGQLRGVCGFGPKRLEMIEAVLAGRRPAA